MRFLKRNAETTVIVYMYESFVHQLHGSAYSYFFMDEAGVVQDGMRRTSGKCFETDHGSCHYQGGSVDLS